MNFYAWFLFVFVFSFNLVHAQDFIGYSNSNYAGVNGIELQPASIADSRFKLDVNVGSASIFGYNNYVALRTEAFTEKDVFNDPKFKTNYLILDESKKSKSLFFRDNIQLPSVMYTLDSITAVAFTVKIRNYVNIDGVEPDLGRVAFEELRYPSIYGNELKNKKLSIQQMGWAEYGAAYARVIKEEKKHFVKVGGRIKLLQGISAEYLFVKDLNYKFAAGDSLLSVQANAQYGYTENLRFKSGGDSYKFTSAPGVGLDLGAVYEYRPNRQTYIYEMDGDTGLYRKDKNKYKLKVGISIIDIGSVRFKKSIQTYDFTADANNWNISSIDIQNMNNFNTGIKNKFDLTSSNKAFRMSLPTAISAQIDYNFYDDFYINITPFMALQRKNDDTKIHELTAVSITPRWDSKWFGVFLPVSYNNLTKTNLGISLRLGPVIVGATNIWSYIGPRPLSGMDFHVALKVPIMYNKTKDKDDDGVSDLKDNCMEVPGLWAFKGCPPDKDGDNIIDKNDSCPDVKGVPEFFGCPDKDGDGVQDKVDQCPDNAGSKEHNGCPDTDNDGIFDDTDVCPALQGTPENKGCPSDKDGDGIFDDEDKCPETFGTKENNGCPTVKKEEQEIINTAFAALEFEKGKNIIKVGSFASLEELAKLLGQKPNWIIKLSGHTDNQGTPDKNMKLSKIRTEAVKKLLVDKGIKEDRVITEWFGQSQPIAPNTTPEGRQKNRRVEMNIIIR